MWKGQDFSIVFILSLFPGTHTIESMILSGLSGTLRATDIEGNTKSKALKSKIWWLEDLLKKLQFQFKRLISLKWYNSDAACLSRHKRKNDRSVIFGPLKSRKKVVEIGRGIRNRAVGKYSGKSERHWNPGDTPLVEILRVFHRRTSYEIGRERECVVLQLQDKNDREWAKKSWLYSQRQEQPERASRRLI